jgi:LysR family glycine cleavage system transcriptional activator
VRDLPPLSALRAFEVAARRQSFKLAAAELAVTPTAISHQIRQLEENLGVPLFVRETRKVTLTQEGRQLFGVVNDAFSSISGVARSLRKSPSPKIATISATVAFTARMLVPNVSEFRRLHPDWNLRLDASDDPVDVAAGDADAAIRYGMGRYPGLESIPLLADAFAPMCSPHYAHLTVATLPRATLIHFDWRPLAAKLGVPTWQSWAERCGLSEMIDAVPRIAFSDESNAIQAAMAGQGIALLSRTLMAKELEAGVLIEPFGPALEGMRYNFVFPVSRADDASIVVLRNWISACFMPAAALAPPVKDRFGPIM